MQEKHKHTAGFPWALERGGGTTRACIVCRVCGRSEVALASHGGGSHRPPAMIVKAFTRAGWALKHNKWKCPTCRKGKPR